MTGTVWVTGRQTPAVQRRDRYMPESMAYPAKMLPRWPCTPATYTRPRELVQMHQWNCQVWGSYNATVSHIA